MKREKQYFIAPESTLMLALKQMDEVGCKLLIVGTEINFQGLLSIGDVQRALIGGDDLRTSIGKVLRSNVTVGKTSDDYDGLKQKILSERIEFMPVINESNEVVDIIFWKDLFKNTHSRYESNLNCPVVIMAGGKGTRLRPITNVIPKPLVPIGEKPIIEHITDSFAKKGVTNFYLSVNYKEDLIRYYYDGLNKGYNINYFKEDKPLGTAGSLFLMKDVLKSTFFISNCDILIDQDYSEIYDHHKLNNNHLTIVSALTTYNIPYGILKVKEDYLVQEIEEKPEYSYLVNTGLYVMEPELLDLMPEGECYHITNLIDKLINMGMRVGLFPVSEGAWLDIGHWKEYQNQNEIFSRTFKNGLFS